MPRFLPAIVISGVMVLSAPFMGQIRAALQRTFPGEFVSIVGGSVALALGAALVVAFMSIREHRAIRFASIATALAVGVTYVVTTATGRAEVDIVERVHFIEYGVIAVLFYRAWRSIADPSVVILPLSWAVLVGILDEWLQWFIPVRVGEARDVVLNVVSIACGLLFGLAIDPPRGFSRRLRPGSLSRAGVTASGVLFVFAAFFSAVHLGHTVRADGVGDFKSHYTAEELDAHARDRAARWRANPPMALRRLSREDQYMDEGLWHARRRNDSWAAGDVARAWSENLILERFFAPVLDTGSYASPSGHRWSSDHRRNALAEVARAGTTPLPSDAEPYPIVDWSKPLFWLIAIVAALGVAGASSWLDRRCSRLDPFWQGG